MAKLYTSKNNTNTLPLRPKTETIALLLNYSKALQVKHYKNLTFDTFLN